MLNVYQIILTDAEIKEVNERGWEASEKSWVYSSRSFENDVVFFEDNFKHYKHVADVDSDDLEEAFHLMNMWSDPNRVKMIADEVMSMSVGDIIKMDEDFYVCMSFGFEKMNIN